MATDPRVTFETLNHEEGIRLFDARSNALLGVSGSEFLRMYRAGYEWPEEMADAVDELAMLIPFFE